MISHRERFLARARLSAALSRRRQSDAKSASRRTSLTFERNRSRAGALPLPSSHFLRAAHFDWASARYIYQLPSPTLRLRVNPDCK